MNLQLPYFVSIQNRLSHYLALNIELAATVYIHVHTFIHTFDKASKYIVIIS